MDAVTQVPPPRNEPVLTYAPGSPERAALQQRLTELAGDRLELSSPSPRSPRAPEGWPFP